MSCLKPLNIVNPAKSFSRYFSDRLILSVPCGHCAECQKTISNEWYYRIMAEWKHTVSHGGFVLMDCLTYDPDCLPHFSDFLSDDDKAGFPAYLDFSCFSHRDIRLFREALRNNLVRAGYDVNNDNFRFFLSSEYGTKDEYVDDYGRTRKGTHRPHYHVLFFCTVPKLKPVQLSLEIGDTWTNGKTDGVRDKGARYVLDSKVFRSDLGASSQASRYVTKYVQKDSEFQDELDKRVNRLVRYFAYKVFDKYEFVPSIELPFDDDCFGGCRYLNPRVDYSLAYDSDNLLSSVDPVASVTVDAHVDWISDYLASEQGKKMRTNIIRCVNQFHRQSTHFGLCALDSIDVDDVMKTGVLHIEDNKKIVLTISLPLYYKRKLFYKLQKIDGLSSWIPTDLGKQYLRLSQVRTMRFFAGRYRALSLQYGLHLDCDYDDMAAYIVYKRGRYRGVLDVESDAYIRSLRCDNWYSYSTSSDMIHFGMRFVTDLNVGNSSIGYHAPHRVRSIVGRGSVHRLRKKVMSYIPLKRFISDHAYFDDYFERVISELEAAHSAVTDGKQDSFDVKQRAVKVFKSVF